MRHVNTRKKKDAIKTQSVFSLGRVKSTAVLQDQGLGFAADEK